MTSRSLYRVVTRDDDGQLIVVGRDLRPISELAATAYWMCSIPWSATTRACMQAETRYRMLFTLASEGILIVDAESLRVLEANPAAGRVFEKPVSKLIGRTFPWGFGDSGKIAIEELLAQVRAAGNAEPLTLRYDAMDTSVRGWRPRCCAAKKACTTWCG